MSFRFQRRIKSLPGLRLNVSKTGKLPVGIKDAITSNPALPTNLRLVLIIGYIFHDLWLLYLFGERHDHG